MELSLIQHVIVWAIPVLLAITLHEVAHGWMAYRFGDRTAYLQGRLTCNPLKHVDPLGTLVVPGLLLVSTGFIFGWAKPVPVDTRAFKKPNEQMAWVALAGPMANAAMALMWCLLFGLGHTLAFHGQSLGVPMLLMSEAGIQINLIIMLLNLLPLPPLDGSRLLLPFLRPSDLRWYAFLERYGIWILVVLMFSGGLSLILGPPFLKLHNLLVGFW